MARAADRKRYALTGRTTAISPDGINIDEQNGQDYGKQTSLILTQSKWPSSALAIILFIMSIHIHSRAALLKMPTDADTNIRYHYQTSLMQSPPRSSDHDRFRVILCTSVANRRAQASPHLRDLRDLRGAPDALIRAPRRGKSTLADTSGDLPLEKSKSLTTADRGRSGPYHDRDHPITSRVSHKSFQDCLRFVRNQ
jgi:hypothetical protein